MKNPLKPRSLSRLVALVLPLILSACHSESRVGLVLPPEGSAAVTVEGENPFVTIDNEGPGTIVVLFMPTGWPTGDPIRLALASTGQTMREGGDIRILNESRERATVRITMQRHGAFSIEQPAPPESNRE